MRNEQAMRWTTQYSTCYISVPHQCLLQVLQLNVSEKAWRAAYLCRSDGRKSRKPNRLLVFPCLSLNYYSCIMPHADSSLIPSRIATKAEFYEFITPVLLSLLEGQRNWITNLSNAASLLYHAFQSFPSCFGSGDRAVNWTGFYLESSMFPLSSEEKLKSENVLLLGPFSGRPACQLIRAQSGKGVCADAFVYRKPVIVDDVDKYPGHIACDNETKSEIVLPIIVDNKAIGVLDLDCVAIAGFDEEDRKGLEKIVKLIVDSCDWNI